MVLEKHFEVYFGLVDDSRHKSYITYKMGEILLIMFCAQVCGLRHEEDIADLAEMRWEYFKKYIKNDRPPCKSTISNMLKIIDPKRLELCFQGVTQSVFGLNLKEETEEKEQVSIDGKTVRGENSVHIVTALQNDGLFSLGTIEVDEKTNEIPAVQELLDIISIEGKVITLDSMHCQKETMAKIIEKKGDYVVQVKRNQPSLYDDIEGIFKAGEIAETRQESEKGHGRFTTWICDVLPDEYVDQSYFVEWVGIKKIFRIIRKTEEKERKSEETSYYITSLDEPAEKLMKYVRNHWQIESFHWILDVVCGEDKSYIQDENAKLCMNILKKYAIAFIAQYIKQTNPKKKSISGNMRKALISTDFMHSLLSPFLHKLLLQFCYFY